MNECECNGNCGNTENYDVYSTEVLGLKAEITELETDLEAERLRAEKYAEVLEEIRDLTEDQNVLSAIANLMD